MTRYFPPLPTAEQLSIASLSDDGNYVSGWVKSPVNKIWEPEDLLWSPPSARKAEDLDRAGTIVDVVDFDGDAWVTAQLEKRERYLEALRQRVRSGSLKLTAFLAKFLKLPFEDGAQLTPLALKSLQEPARPDGPIWQPPRRHWVG